MKSLVDQKKLLIKNERRIESVFAPLRQIAQTHYFAYEKIDDDNHYSVIGTDLNVIETLFDYEILQYDPFLSKRECYQASSNYFPLHYIKKENLIGEVDKITDVIVQKFPLYNSFLIVNKKPGFIEVCTFTSAIPDSRVCNLYLNEITLLKQYIKYFTSELEPLLQDLKSTEVSIYDVVGTRYDAIRTDLNTQCSEQTRCAFQRMIATHLTPANLDEHFKEMLKLNANKEFLLQKNGKNRHVKITEQEYACLVYLAHGYSSKEIGIALKLSFRTVESYLSHLKVKLDARYKKELIDAFWVDVQRREGR